MEGNHWSRPTWKIGQLGLLVKGHINTTDYKVQVFGVWEGRVTTMPYWTHAKQIQNWKAQSHGHRMLMKMDF